MAAKKYRLLKAGEVVLPTDEIYMGHPFHKWFSGSLNCGKKLPANQVGYYRRQELAVAGRTVRAKRPVQQRKVVTGRCETCISYNNCPYAWRQATVDGRMCWRPAATVA